MPATNKPINTPKGAKAINTITGLEVVRAGPNNVKIVATISAKTKPKLPNIICDRNRVRPMPLSSGSTFSAK